MKLSWSHAVIYVRDQETMLSFYIDVLGFQITDRGPLGKSPKEIVFMSQDPEEHHQLAMIETRQGDEASNSVAHFAFRVQSFDEIKHLCSALEQRGNAKISPLSHGNTLSIYFADPEKNGIEVFWDTPWHVAQPQGEQWDTSMSEGEALDWVQATFKDQSGFAPKEDYHQQRRGELADH